MPCRYSCSLAVLYVLFALHGDVCKVLDKLLNLGWGKEMAELRAEMGTGGRGELVGPTPPEWDFVQDSEFRARASKTRPWPRIDVHPLHPLPQPGCPASCPTGTSSNETGLPGVPCPFPMPKSEKKGVCWAR